LTGVQRYTLELLKRFGAGVLGVEPPMPLHGVLGHAWEQAALPLWVRGRLLWSPGNTGPLSVERQVLTVHDLSAFDCPDHLNPRFVAWYRWLIPRLVRRLRRVLVASIFSKERLVALTGIDPERVAVVPLGVDGRFHPRPQAEVARVRSVLGIPTAHYLLSLGSLEPRKNLPRLLHAWAEVRRRLPDDISLVVVGAKGSRRVFRQLDLKDLPENVHLTGYVEDDLLPALYSGALAFVYLSEYEGFGLPPLEAMACGVPVVSSERAALPEVVGGAGLLVEPMDLDAVQAAIHTVVDDSGLRATMRAQSLSQAKSFSWDRTADQTWRLLIDSAG
jgi:glycosyltransferase involved in cell wall biosynthesis